MNILDRMNHRSTRKVPRVQADTGALLSPRWIVALQALIGFGVIAWSLTFMIPGISAALGIAYLLCVLSVVKQYNPLLVYVNIGLIAIVAIAGDQNSITVEVLTLSILVVLTLRTHSLLQFSRAKVKIEAAVLLHEAKLTLAVCGALWVLGGLTMLLGGIGDGNVALIVSVLAATILVGAAFSDSIRGWFQSRIGSK